MGPTVFAVPWHPSEMAGSHLEMETAFPNCGKEDYMNGLQPNIRPQSLTILFKRPAR
jgi:hypothetical protein